MGYSFYHIREGVYNHRSITGRLLAAGAAVLFAIALTISLSASAATTVVVTPSETNGWVFFDDNGNGGSGSFVSGPETPPLGEGSAQLELTTDDQGYALGNGGYAGTRLDEITSLGYSTYVQTGNNTVAPALQFNIDADLDDDDESWQGRLVYEPYHAHAVFDNEWQAWDTLDNAAAGNWWFSNGTLAGETGCAQANPCTWTEVLTAVPDAGVHATIPGVLFKAGSGWTEFVGNVDAFAIGINGDEVIYNFELTAPLPVKPATKEECFDGGWQNFQTEYKNQGQCVASVQANEKSVHKRP